MTIGAAKQSKVSKRERRRQNREKRTAEAAAAAAASAAVEAANWTDRDGKARPTPERKARGNFRLVDGRHAGETVAVDTAVTALDKLMRAALITPAQCQAGHDLAALLERTRVAARPRSCLDFSPRGFSDDTPEPSHAELRDEQERIELYLSCGVAIWAALWRLCVEDKLPHSMELPRRGLEIVVRYWGLDG